MVTKIRKNPLFCICISIIYMLTGKLRFLNQNIGYDIKMEDDKEFNIFRQIVKHPIRNSEDVVTFIVQFKFSRLSHKANCIASIIPMLMITGYPGFQSKAYAVCYANGYWQGMYQWQSSKHLHDYLNSFVYKMMNKRAISSSIESREYKNMKFSEYIRSKQLN